MAWSFDGVSFAIFDGGTVFDEWFTTKQVLSIDPSLGGQRRIVDVGGVTYDPLSLMAQTTVQATRDSLVALLGTTGTLVDDDGRTCTALLAAATPVRVITPTSGRYRARLVFEFIE